MTAPAISTEALVRPPQQRRRRTGARAAAAGRYACITVTIGITVAMLVPVAVVALFSLSSSKSLAAFGHFSMRWYQTFAHDSSALASLRLSLGIAVVVTVLSALIGTSLAIGVHRGRRLVRPVEVTMLFNLITPEIVTAVALLLLFSRLAIQLSPATIVAGHVTFSIVYVTLVVTSRLSGIPASLEEAAMDLGDTQFGALRRIAFPLILPAVIGASLIVFLFSFDDFVTSFFLSGSGTRLRCRSSSTA